jgi:polysaccharide export outer membrane protein
MFKLYISFLALLLSVSACSSRRNLVYFNDLSNNSEVTEKIVNKTEPKIQTADVLDIAVNTLSTESNVLFTANPNRQNSVTGPHDKDGYRVDNFGFVNFPVAGSVKLAGLTIEEAEEVMAKEINKYVKNPIVNIKYLNFKITVIGEVNRPETFTITNERISLLEALAEMCW